MYGHYIYYEIFRTEYVDHDQEDNKCDDKDIAQTPTVTECIEEHINVKLVGMQRSVALDQGTLHK